MAACSWSGCRPRLPDCRGRLESERHCVRHLVHHLTALEEEWVPILGRWELGKAFRLGSARAESGSDSDLGWRIASLASTIEATIADNWSETGGAEVTEILPGGRSLAGRAMRARVNRFG